ncbi:hypothetical protein EOD41_18695 [Mucilaginibacter limnophilus]|uniref:Uncharacterized protein n=1 Tax=Mucilaginibacter limnophilus TaxID=1932778 RepID=A0A437MI58_9SPHI|nr:hypothetical protein [Mucilaginibacter limnophilus]RVT97329.1 hypothetical protein EOD41_18695 [Mucilaginibacter limnophilus]
MDKLEFNIFSEIALLTLPHYFRNDNWSTDFGKVQLYCNSENVKPEFIIDLSKCLWIDPLPLLSLIISLKQVNLEITKKVILKSEDNHNDEQCRLMSFLEKEGFLDQFTRSGCSLLILESEDKYRVYNDRDRDEYKNYENSLRYSDSTIIKAQVVDLSEKVTEESLDDWVDALLADQYKLTHKITETSKDDIFSRVSLFLKETLDNIYEHAYPTQSSRKYAGFYIRFRKGLADNSLDMPSRIELKNTIDKEHKHCPTLEKYFLEDISSFIEIFVIDSGIGIAKSFYKDIPKSKKFPFREAWRQIIGFGHRGQDNPKKKSTKYGGLYSLGRLLHQNYLTVRDHNEWIGDVLPIKEVGDNLASNRSYLLISDSQLQLYGAALIGRITWKAAADENPDWGIIENLTAGEKNDWQMHPFAVALRTDKDIYLKYQGKPFNEFPENPFYIRDDKYNYSDKALSTYYLKRESKADFCLYLPKPGATKNVIHNIVENDFINLESKSKTLIIGDIPVWETNVYQLALKDAAYSSMFLERFDRLILVSKRLSVLLLERRGKTFVDSAVKRTKYLSNSSSIFNPANCFSHYIEWVRTHDSMIYWQYLNHTNKLNEYYINAEIIWSQGLNAIGLNGYLNFSKTLTDRFCMTIYKDSLERTLCLNNRNGCYYESIDVLTNKLCQQFNSLFYNRVQLGAQRILLGSVVVTGHSAKSVQTLASDYLNALVVHFFYNLNSEAEKSPLGEMHLLLWPLKGQAWFADNVLQTETSVSKGKFERVGSSHVIAPSGWKYFPIPRYKLFDLTKRRFIDTYSPIQAGNEELYRFISIYKCTPPETYRYWQGKKNEVISIGHTNYESNHDLFKIDFPFALNQSFALGDGLAIFLLGEFVLALGIEPSDLISDNGRLIDGVANYVKHERDFFSKSIFECSLIVYPYHYNTEHAIELIKNYLPESYHSKIIAIFPINKDRYGSTFLPSPITIETIAQNIFQEKENIRMEGNGRQLNAMLFDDATIGGKTRSDIAHILYSLDINNVKTVSMVERSRLPFSTSYPYKHKAFWRLDIPKLGDDDSCPICRAFKEVDNFSNILISQNAIDRINSWRSIWSKRTPFEMKGTKILTPTMLNLKEDRRYKKFGIYYDGISHQQCGGAKNKIELTTSIGLSIYTAELYSNTSKDDVVIEYLALDEVSNSAKLEMLCTNLLLFGREFSNTVKKNIIIAIFMLAELSEENNLTAMAAIALISQKREHLDILFEEVKDSQAVDVQVKNQDMHIVLSRLSSFRGSKFYGSKKLMRLHTGFQDLKVLYKQFHSELYNDFGLAHDTPLQLVIREITNSLRTINAIEDSCDKVIFLLEKIPIWHLRKIGLVNNAEADTTLKSEINNHLNSAKEFLANKSNNLFVPETAKKFKSIVRAAIDHLKAFHDRLFLCVNGLDAWDMGDVLADLIKQQQLQVGVSRNIKRPLQKSLDYSNWICWDREVISSVCSIIGNARHCNKNLILDYYNENESNSVKSGWITVDIGERYLTIKMINFSKQTANEISSLTGKRNKPEKLHLKELNINVNYVDVKYQDNTLVETIIEFPYLNTY